MHHKKRTATYRSFTISLAMLTVLGCESHKSVLAPDAQADHVVVEKSKHTLTLLANGTVLKTYRVSLGKGNGKAKEREGDHETPEGFYVVDSRNARSRFHRALHISYPNDEDRKRATVAGVAPGGEIMIHGIQNGLGWIGSLQRTIDWTDGCVAVTDPEIEEIWNLVPTGTPVEIRH
jgi:murein L,D-transpeptidase YafK